MTLPDAETAVVLGTRRLRLRKLGLQDAGFILELVNDPDWLRHIGDRGVRTPEDARAFIEAGPLLSYEAHGFGLWLTELRSDAEPIGLCGILKRDYLDYPDLGYALLPGFRQHGYAREASAGVLKHARLVLGIPALDAIVSPRNRRSIRLLKALGFDELEMIEIPPDGHTARLFRCALKES